MKDLLGNEVKTGDILLELGSGYVPHEVVLKVLELTGFQRTRVNNGEIGIAGMYDILHYQAIIEHITFKNIKNDRTRIN